jgi:hypothetical protein
MQLPSPKASHLTAPHPPITRELVSLIEIPTRDRSCFVSCCYLYNPAAWRRGPCSSREAPSTTGRPSPRPRCRRTGRWADHGRGLGPGPPDQRRGRARRMGRGRRRTPLVAVAAAAESAGGHRSTAASRQPAGRRWWWRPGGESGTGFGLWTEAAMQCGVRWGR